MAEGPVFALYVRSVEGHLVPRFGTREYIGATLRGLTAEQRAAGQAAVQWDTERIVPITARDTVTYRKEYETAIQTGALKQVSEAEYLEQVKPEPAVEGKQKATSKPKGAG